MVLTLLRTEREHTLTGKFTPESKILIVILELFISLGSFGVSCLVVEILAVEISSLETIPHFLELYVSFALKIGSGLGPFQTYFPKNPNIAEPITESHHS